MMQSFCSTIYLAGLNETYRTKYNVIRALWIFTFICGFIFTGYFIYNVIEEYQSNPIATKVYLDHEKGLVFPDIFLDIKSSFDVLNEFGVSENTKYYINQLQSASSMSMPDGFNETQGKLDVENFFETHNLNTKMDFAKLMFARFHESFEIVCRNCELNAHCESLCRKVFYYTAFNSLRYKIKLDALDRKVGVGRGNKQSNTRTFRLYHKEENISDFYLTEIYMDHIQLRKIESVRKLVKVKGQMLKRHKETRDACSDKSDHSTLDCFKLCKLHAEEKCMGGEFIDGNIMDTKNISTTIFSFPDDLDEMNVIMTCAKEEFEKCANTCVPPCTDILYDIVETVEGSSDFPEYQIELSHAFFGMVIFEQTSSYSFQSAVSNIGGQLGLWLGLSIVTVIQVVMFFVDICYDKMRGSKLHDNQRDVNRDHETH